MNQFRQRKIRRLGEDQRPKKRTQTIGTLITIIVLTVIGCLCVIGYNLIGNLYSVKPKCSICESKNRLILNREDITTSLIVVSSPVNNKLTGAWLLIEKEQSPIATVFYIPPGVSAGDYTGDFNSYIQVSDLEYAGMLLNSSRAKEYSIWQLENMSGFTIQKYLWIDSSALGNYAQLFGDVGEGASSEYTQKYDNPSNVSQSATLVNSLFDHFSIMKLVLNAKVWNSFMRNVDTNISASELPIYFMHMKNILNAGNHTMIDLSQTWAGNKVQSDSGRSIETVNYIEYDKKIEQIFSNIRPREIEREQARVEVYNGSEVAGLASRYARRIQNFGVNVVRYDNAPDSVDRTTIYINDQVRFKNSFEGVQDVVCEKCNVVNGRPNFITTGDIVIILGKEKLKEISWR